MNGLRSNLYIGVVLVAIGMANLLFNLNFIDVQEEWVPVALFLSLSGYLFLRFRQSGKVVLLIFAAITAFVGTAVLLGGVYRVNEEFIGLIFLWGLSALFAYGYFRNGRSWGFVIPAGIFFTLGLLVLIDSVRGLHDDLIPSIFFAGLASTFGFLYLIKDETNKLDWARYPALILGLFAGFVFLVTTRSHVLSFLLPLIFILLGGYLVYQATHRKTLRKS